MKNMYKLLAAVLAFTMTVSISKAQITVDATLGTLTGNYTTLKAAFDNINNGTHQGVINIRVHSNTTETDSCRLDSSGANGLANYSSVLIRPADTVTVNKTIATAISGITIVFLNGADNITIDGRPLSLGTNRLLTFLQSNPNTNALSCAIRMINGVSNCTLSFLNTTLSTTTASVASINISISTSQATTGNRRITISDCFITGGIQGINMTGTIANFIDSVVIQRNTILNAQGSSIIVNAVKTITIDSNTIFHNASFTGWNLFGLNINPNVAGINYSITKNNIHSLQTGSAAQMGGILISPATTLSPIPLIVLSNNHVSLLSTNAGLTFARAFQFQGAGASDVRCFHNTFRLGGSGTGTAANPASIAVAKSNTGAAGTFIFNNNICINTRTGAANPHIGFWNSQVTAGTNTMDFNLYSGPVFGVIANGFYQDNTANFRTAAAPNEQNSIIGPLTFDNNTGPILTSGATNNTSIRLVGTPSAITSDIYGVTRNGVNPYKGAFEGPSANIVSNDLTPVIIYTFGKIPTGTVDTIRAVIRNNGLGAATSIPVTLTSSLAGIIGTTNVTIASGNEQTINMPVYTPTILGFDTIRVIVSPDAMPANDTVLWVRENTLNALSYSRPFVNQFGNVGTNPEGEIVAKFTTPVTNFINQVNVNFTNVGFTGPWPFQVVIYPDSGGINGPSRVPLFVSATQNTVNGIFNLSLPSIPVSGSFYLGVRQTSANNIGFAYQNENPIRNRTFYFRQGTGFSSLAWNDFAVNANNQFRFMIEPRLKINDDLGVTDVLLPSNGCNNPNATQEIRVAVQNLGLLNQNFATNNLTVGGAITDPNNVTTSLGPIVINTGTLLSDSTLNVLLAPSYNMSLQGNYTIRAWTVSSIDNNKVNDTLPLITRIVNVANPVPFTQTFNGGLTIPAGFDNNRFAVTAGIGTQSSNALRVNLFGPAPFTSNAFFISPRISGITANTVCRFDYRVTDDGTGAATVLGRLDSIKVMISTDCGLTFTQVFLRDSASHFPSINYATIEIPLGTFVGNDVRIKLQCDWFGTSNDANVDIDNFRVLNLTNDIAATSVTAPCNALLQGSAPIAPSAGFTNRGLNNLTGVTVNYIITGPVNYTGSGTIASINAGQSQSVVFTPLFNPTTPGTYTAKIFSGLSTDGDPFNDTLTYTFVVVSTTQVNAGNALSFNGSQFAQVSNNPTLNPSLISIEGWANRGATATGNRTIISKDSNIINGQYAIWINSSNNLIFTLNTTSGGNAAVSTNTIPAGSYFHFAATYDGSFMRLYINGRLEAATAHTGTIRAFNTNLNIGANFAGEFFEGSIDEIKIWNVARNADSIRSNMHRQLPPTYSPSLVAHYRFDETGGNFSADFAGNCNTVILTSAIWPTRIAATYPLSNSLTYATQTITTDGSYPFTGTEIALGYTGFSGIDTIGLYQLRTPLIGTSPITAPGGITSLYGKYWIAYKYGTGAFTFATVTPSFVSGSLLSGVVVNDLKLYTRGNGANGAWTRIRDNALSVNFATQSATFVDSTGAIFGSQFSIGANNNPLPVDLLYFNGRNSNGNSLLNWATASELENAGFSIERSVDGKNFEQISYVKGNGNSNDIHQYQFTDKNAFAISNSDVLYYRLVQTDFNGEQTISDVIKLSSSEDESFNVSAYPNPFTNSFTMQIETDEETSILVKVTDIAGRALTEQNYNLSKGVHALPINQIADMPQGVYFIKYSINNQSYTLKLLKQ